MARAYVTCVMQSRPEAAAVAADGSARIPPSARVVVLVGPTAVGKTEVAVSLCERFDGEVISLDSRQLVRRLEIGTAKPSAEERRRAPHHLIDVAEPAEAWPLTRVVAAARRAVAEVHGRGKLPVVAGGTGQYVWALAEGWRVPNVPPDPPFRARMAALAEREGGQALHARLAAVDAVSAAEIDARNVRRVIRALEIHHHTGQPKSVVAGKDGPPCPMLTLGLSRPREQLYARIDARIERMIEAGLEAEVRSLVGAGLGFDLPAMTSLGYREWRPYLAGEIDHAEVLRRIRANTRRLVRTQSNWFGPDDSRIQWLSLAEVVAEPAALDAIADRVAAFLAAEDPRPPQPLAIRPPLPDTEPTTMSDSRDTDPRDTAPRDSDISRTDTGSIHDPSDPVNTARSAGPAPASRRARFEQRYAAGQVPWDDALPPPEIRALAAEIAPGRALDLGCGYGRAAIYLAGAGWQVDAVDYVGAAVEGARRRVAQAGVADSVRVHQGDVSTLTALGLPGPYDLAIDVGCLHGLDDEPLRRLANELARVLRPGALFLLFAHLRRPPLAEGEGDAAGAPPATPGSPTWLDESLLLRLLAPDFELESHVYGTTRAGDRGEVPSAWYRFRRRAQGETQGTSPR